jgi:hypothetical protein
MTFQPPVPVGQPQLQIFEETTYLAFAGMATGKTDDGMDVLSFVLPNGRKLTFVLNAEMSTLLHRATSPIDLADASLMQKLDGKLNGSNGH